MDRWVLQPKQPAPDLRFGWSVAVSGSVVVVGAPRDATNGPKSGAAYVFEQRGAQWTETKLVPPDGEANARFGWKVGVQDGRVVVTAPWASNPVDGRSGKIYLYHQSGGMWQHELLPLPDRPVEGQIGRGLALAGDRVVAGAPYDSTANGSASGSVTVFEETSRGWTSETLVPDQGAPDAWFGLTVTADQARIAAGGYHTRQASGPEAGAASVFERDETGSWTERPLAPIAQPSQKDHFGRALAVLGPSVFVGAEEDDNANGTDAGGLFALRPDRPPRLLLPPNGSSRSYFGFVVAATDRLVAASQGAEVHLFSGIDREPSHTGTLRGLTGTSMPSAVSAMAGDGRRLVVGAATADASVPNVGSVVVVEFAP